MLLPLQASSTRPARPFAPRLAALALPFALAIVLGGCGSISVSDLMPGSSTPSTPAQPAATIGSGQVKVGLILPLAASGNAAVAAQSMPNPPALPPPPSNTPPPELLPKHN